MQKQAAKVFEYKALPKVSYLSVESKIELTDKYWISFTSSDSLLVICGESSLPSSFSTLSSSDSSL
jgi:hypothetical protein